MLIKSTFQLDIEPALLQAYHIDIRNTLFFDIETTGFAAKTSQLYLIGAACYREQDNSFCMMQWLNETGQEDAAILNEFLNFARPFSTLIHYNGDGFDIPYLKETAKKHDLHYSLSHTNSFDLYKQLRPCSKLLALSHIKQKNIEKFLGIQRKDKKNGGELITLYKTYLKHPCEDLQSLLLLHNAEDVAGLIRILPILAYPLACSGHYKVTRLSLEENTANLQLSLDYTLPKRVSCGKGNLLLTAHKKECTFHLPIYTGELKFFYPNYRDYYYLPLEDTAIHKSVAFYVDKEYRTQAKAATCYSKKSGLFLPQPEPVISPYFKLEYGDHITYFEITEEQLQDYEGMQSYANSLFHYLFHESSFTL